MMLLQRPFFSVYNGFSFFFFLSLCSERLEGWRWCYDKGGCPSVDDDAFGVDGGDHKEGGVQWEALAPSKNCHFFHLCLPHECYCLKWVLIVDFNKILMINGSNLVGIVLLSINLPASTIWPSILLCWMTSALYLLVSLLLFQNPRFRIPASRSFLRGYGLFRVFYLSSLSLSISEFEERWVYYFARRGSKVIIRKCCAKSLMTTSSSS